MLQLLVPATSLDSIFDQKPIFFCKKKSTQVLTPKLNSIANIGLIHWTIAFFPAKNFSQGLLQFWTL